MLWTLLRNPKKIPFLNLNLYKISIEVVLEHIYCVEVRIDIHLARGYKLLPRTDPVISNSGWRYVGV